MRARGCDLQGTLGMWLAEDLGQVDVMRGRCGCRRLNRRRLVKRGAFVPVDLELPKMVDPDDRCRGCDLRLRRVGRRDIEPPDAQPVEVRDDRQGAADRADGAVERQLAEPGGVRWQAAVLRGVDDSRRHRQVEATPLFGQLRWREVDGHLSTGKLESAVVDRDLDPLASFLQRSVAQSHDMKPGETVGNVRLDLDPDAVEAEDRPGQGPGQHQRRYYTVLYMCVSLVTLHGQRRTLPSNRYRMQLKQTAARSLGWLTSLPFRLNPRIRIEHGLLGNGRLSIRGPGRVLLEADVNAWSHAEVNRLITTRPEAVIRIGRHARLNGCTIVAAERVEVGADCVLGSCEVRDHLPYSESPADRRRPGQAHPVIIEDNVWIGGQVSVLPGVRIGRDSVVGIHAVLFDDVPAGVIVGGNPARVLRRLDLSVSGDNRGQ
jgi:acetyltransferase-like isoleucine patch superfamily enzyme